MHDDSITKYLQLPFRFDVGKLQRDLQMVSAQRWRPQLYKMNYEGAWTSIALYAKGGSSDTFASAVASPELRETEAVKDCPYFKTVVATFRCPLITVRLLKLGPQSVIKPHRDYRLGYENDNFRLHIPIVTDPAVEFILGGDKLEMQAGECWYTNVNFTHSVANRGSSDRVHLVIDAERNAWSDELFFSLAPKASFNLPAARDTLDTLQRSIEELRRQNKPELEVMIQKLERELATAQAERP